MCLEQQFLSQKEERNKKSIETYHIVDDDVDLITANVSELAVSRVDQCTRFVGLSLASQKQEIAATV